jgi:hypothetical protein
MHRSDVENLPARFLADASKRSQRTNYSSTFADFQNSVSGFPSLMHRIVEGGSVLKA